MNAGAKLALWGALLAVVLLNGCASVERSWYGCDGNKWRGWDYQVQCARLDGFVIRERY